METYLYTCSPFWLVKVDSLASVSNYILKEILHSGKWKQFAWLVETNFSIFLILLSVEAFLPSVNLSLQQIFNSD